jgi:hypothetical protein
VSCHDHASLDSDALPHQVQHRERVGAHLLDRDLVEHLDLEVAKDSGCQVRSAVARDVVVADVDACQRACDRHEVRKKNATLNADISPLHTLQVELRNGVVAHHLHRYAANLARAGAGDSCKQ